MMTDTDFPAITPGKRFLLDFLPQVPVTEKPEGYYREDLEGFRSASMTTPETGQVGAVQQYGQRQGGPIFGETVITGDPLISRTIKYSPPNAILKTPHLDSPYMDQLIDRKFKPLKPPGPKGPQLPSFV